MNQREERIRKFEQIRDLPYRIGIGREADCSCETKARLLSDEFAGLGLQSRLVGCTFRWSELNIPREILNLAPSDVDAHAYLQVRLPERKRWVAVDPSWDPALNAVLPVARWDGLNSTRLAVKARNKAVVESPCTKSSEARMPPRFSRAESRFLRAINKFLQTVRETRRAS